MPSDEEIVEIYRDYEPTEVYKQKIYKKTVTAMAKIIRAGFYEKNKNKTFLDVGCNIGAVANAARLVGYEATGIDLDIETIAKASSYFKKCNYESVSSIELTKTGKKYDLVFCMEVIEHTPHIHEFAQSLRDLTNKNGVLYLTTPDAGHRRVSSDFVSWKHVKPPEHLVWFNKLNITKILEDHGFKIIKIFKNHRTAIKLLATAI